MVEKLLVSNDLLVLFRGSVILDLFFETVVNLYLNFNHSQWRAVCALPYAASTFFS